MKGSIRAKIFRVSLVLIVITVILFAVFGVLQVRRFAGIMENTNRDQNTVIMDTMSDSMRAITMENFQKYVTAETQMLDVEFEAMRHDLEVLAQQVQMVLENPSAYAAVEVSPPSQTNAGKTSLQLLFSDNADRSDPVLKDQIMRIGGLGNMMQEIVEGSRTVSSCMVSLSGGATIIADSVPENRVDASGQVRSYNAARRSWYAGAVAHQSAYFSLVNRDNEFETYRVMAGVPVYIGGELAAVCGGSIQLESLEDVISKGQLGEFSDTCLIDKTGTIIYSSRTDGELGLADNEQKKLTESSNTHLVTLVNEALEGGMGFSLLPVDGTETYIAFAPVKTIGWTQLLMIPQEELNSTAHLITKRTNAIMEESISGLHSNEFRMILAIMSIAIALILFVSFTSMLFADRLSRPIKQMTQQVSEIQGDNIAFKMDRSLRTGDEIEVLADSFASMSEKMQGYIQEIVQITAEKERLDTELSVASAIQANMLPSTFPAFPSRKEFDLYAVMDPAREVGGDFYDFFLLDDDHLALVMADVSGKGVPAALFMVISKTLLKNVTLSGVYNSPAEILSDVNNRLCEGNEDNMFVTVWLGILTISTGRLVSASAGHEYPVFYRKSSGFSLEKDRHGMAMGAMEGSRYRETSWQMNPGDMLFLYTDGVPEANNSREELFGIERMLSALESSLKEIVSATQQGNPDLKLFLRTVRRHVDSFVGETPQFDDLTMMCVSYLGDSSTSCG